MNPCFACPRNCGCDRDLVMGYCGMGSRVVVARAALHHWEEPCISGTMGSGTVFFSGCNLKCVYCQNYAISHEGYGIEVTTQKLVEIFYNLIAQGAHNINLVNPTHFTHIIKEALAEPLSVPVVYNTSGYEKVTTLKELEGKVSIYLPDLKYVEDDIALKFSHAKDYAQYAKNAILEMIRQVPENCFDEDGIMQRGVIVRHLLLPGNVKNTINTLKWIKENLPSGTMVSLMAQYTPCGDAKNFPDLNKLVTQREYDKALDCLFELGLEDGFVQDLISADEAYIPSFDLTGVL